MSCGMNKNNLIDLIGSDETLLYGDCLDLMKQIPDNSVDMVLTDPPYGTTACKWDSIIPFEPMWDELKRIVKDNGAICIFGSEPFSSNLRMSNTKNFKYDWLWIKNKHDGFLNAKRQPLRENEIVSVFNTKTYNPQYRTVPPFKHKKTATGVKSSTHGKINKNKPEYEMRDYKYPTNVLRFDKPKKRLHPTQKPVGLLEYLVKTYTLENETVLDFTMGSGSTGVACKNLNRKFIGIEKDDKYFEIATKRINGEYNGK
jgi:site-specific DNA-methyltransferase (adenine-specific)